MMINVNNVKQKAKYIEESFFFLTYGVETDLDSAIFLI